MLFSAARRHGNGVRTGWSIERSLRWSSLQSPIFVLMIVRKGKDCYYIKLGVRRMYAGNTGKQLTFQSRANGINWRSPLFRPTRKDWQDDAEGRSVALIIGGSETTLMSFDNGARHRKPNAHSLALRRDECVEYAVATNDARTVIDDLEQHGPVVKGACSNENLRC